MNIRVECYSGYKVNQRPIKFWIDEKVFFVEAIEDQWRGTDATFFRVRADDNNTYLISYNETADIWSLSSASTLSSAVRDNLNNPR
jgi:hypothetical protein